VNNGVEFSKLLQFRIGEVKFSSHAATRMKSRSIEMTPEMMGKLQKAVDGAAGKGARDSLILLKNYAFIVNIPNRTVVTAMDGEGMKENIFTNIDSAVVAD
jgi:flagellar operon protein